jgi:signal transduction histidine kinase
MLRECSAAAVAALAFADWSGVQFSSLVDCGAGCDGSMAAVAWLLPLAYRSVLWRRRKSVRPSREVQLERRRIAEALHDDVGSQLVQLISLTDLGTNPAIRSNAE